MRTASGSNAPPPPSRRSPYSENHYLPPGRWPPEAAEVVDLVRAEVRAEEAQVVVVVEQEVRIPERHAAQEAHQP